MLHVEQKNRSSQVKDARLLAVLADILTQPFPALNSEVIFAKFPRNISNGEVCICCFDATCINDDVVCPECDAHLRGPVQS